MYAAAERSTLLHAAVHLHMFLADCLLIGVDPVRPLAVVIMAQWYTATGRALARERRTARTARPGAVGPGLAIRGKYTASPRGRWP